MASHEDLPTVLETFSEDGSTDGSTPNKCLKCEYCEWTFSKNLDLLHHLECHDGKRPFLCTDCGKAFKTQGVFDSHKRYHKGDGVINCQVCRKPFLSVSAYNGHLASHTRKLSYKCWNCQRTFETSRLQYQMHLEQCGRNCNQRTTSIVIETEVSDDKDSSSSDVHVLGDPKDRSSFSASINGAPKGMNELQGELPTSDVDEVKYISGEHELLNNEEMDISDAKEADDLDCRIEISNFDELPPSIDLGGHHEMSGSVTETPSVDNAGSSRIIDLNGTSAGPNMDVDCAEDDDLIDGWTVELAEDKNSDEDNVVVSDKPIIITSLTSSTETVHANSDQLPNLVGLESPTTDVEHRVAFRHIIPTSNDIKSIKSQDGENLENTNLVHQNLSGKYLKCSVCSKAFHTSQAWLEHMSMHYVYQTYNCSRCDKSFNTLGYFDLHVRQHDGPTMFLCSVCHTQSVDFDTYRRHVQGHQYKYLFKCPRCSQPFVLRQMFLEHLMNTKCGKTPEECLVCHKEFSHLLVFDMHVKQHRMELSESEGLCEEVSTICHNIPLLPDTLFRCAVCFKDFSENEFLLKHLEKHFEESLYECMRCDRSFCNRDYFLSHVQKHFTQTTGEHSKFQRSGKSGSLDQSESDKKPQTLQKSEVDTTDATSSNVILEVDTKVNCRMCPVVCKTVKRRVAHEQTHKRKVYVCLKCGKRFKEQYYKHHIKKCGKRTNRCVVCGECFDWARDLQSHSYECRKKQRTDESRKPFKCSKCTESFNSWWKLNNHIKLHIGDYRHRCSTCEKTYQSYGGYKNHMVSSHKAKECGKCEELFLDETVYLDHLNQSKEQCNECRLCKLSFCSLSGLEQHKINEHNEVKNVQMSPFEKPLGETLGAGHLARNGNTCSIAGLKAKKRSVALVARTLLKNGRSKKKGLTATPKLDQKGRKKVNRGSKTEKHVRKCSRTDLGPIVEVDVDVPYPVEVPMLNGSDTVFPTGFTKNMDDSLLTAPESLDGACQTFMGHGDQSGYTAMELGVSDSSTVAGANVDSANSFGMPKIVDVRSLSIEPSVLSNDMTKREAYSNTSEMVMTGEQNGLNVRLIPNESADATDVQSQPSVYPQDLMDAGHETDHSDMDLEIPDFCTELTGDEDDRTDGTKSPNVSERECQDVASAVFPGVSKDTGPASTQLEEQGTARALDGDADDNDDNDGDLELLEEWTIPDYEEPPNNGEITKNTNVPDSSKVPNISANTLSNALPASLGNKSGMLGNILVTAASAVVSGASGLPSYSGCPVSNSASVPNFYIGPVSSGTTMPNFPGSPVSCSLRMPIVYGGYPGLMMTPNYGPNQVRQNRFIMPNFGGYGLPGNLRMPSFGRGVVPDNLRMPNFGRGVVPDTLRMPNFGRGVVPDTLGMPNFGRGVVPDTLQMPNFGRGVVPDNLRMPNFGRGVVPDRLLMPNFGRGGVLDSFQLPNFGREGISDSNRMPNFGGEGVPDILRMANFRTGVPSPNNFMPKVERVDTQSHLGMPCFARPKPSDFRVQNFIAPDASVRMPNSCGGVPDGLRMPHYYNIPLVSQSPSSTGLATPNGMTLPIRKGGPKSSMSQFLMSLAERGLTRTVSSWGNMSADSRMQELNRGGPSDSARMSNGVRDDLKMFNSGSAVLPKNILPNDSGSAVVKEGPRTIDSEASSMNKTVTAVSERSVSEDLNWRGFVHNDYGNACIKEPVSLDMELPDISENNTEYPNRRRISPNDSSPIFSKNVEIKNFGAPVRCLRGKELEDYNRESPSPEQSEMIDNNDKPFKCFLCNEHFATKDEVIAHLNSHSEGEDKPLEIIDDDLEMPQEIPTVVYID